MNNDTIIIWRDAITDPPKTIGWYNVRLKSGTQAKVPFIHNSVGELVWLAPDESEITHWSAG